MKTPKKMPVIGMSNENVLNISDAEKYLAERIMQSKFVDDGLELDGEILTKAQEYGIDGSIRERVDRLSVAVIRNLQDVEGFYQGFTSEALDRINKEFLIASIDAAYSQNTNAPHVMAQALGASEHKNGDIFTSAELLEAAPYVVDDYEGFAHFAMTRETYSFDHDELSATPINVEWGDREDLNETFKGSLRFEAQINGRELSEAINDLASDDLNLER